MAGATLAAQAELLRRPGRGGLRSLLLRWTLITLALAFLAALLLAPLAVIFSTALERGFVAAATRFTDPDTRHAIQLTLLVAAIVVPLNTLFGIAAAWAIAKFEFPAKSLLITVIDLPFAVSPVISGLVYVLLFGAQGVFGQWLLDRDIAVIFALLGIVMATLFVTFPYVARELIPLMQQLGNDEEEAAITLGASGLMTFVRVTLPKVNPLQRAGHGRVRRRVGGLRPHPGPHQHDAAAHRDPV